MSEEAVLNSFSGWVKSDIWGGPESNERFYQSLKLAFDEIGMLWLDPADFADGIWSLVEEVQPSADRDRVSAIIENCCVRIKELNDFFEANRIHSLVSG